MNTRSNERQQPAQGTADMTPPPPESTKPGPQEVLGSQDPAVVVLRARESSTDVVCQGSRSAFAGPQHVPGIICSRFFFEVTGSRLPLLQLNTHQIR